MEDAVQTVLGPVSADQLGRTSIHEHICSVYGAWGKLLPEPRPEWEQAVLDHYTPLLTQLRRRHDCRTIVEVTPSWGGRGKRDLEVWADLSRRTGVHIVATTGYLFGYAPLPEFFRESSPPEIADRFIRDIEDGMEGTNVRAGVLKAHVPESAEGIKLLRAVAIAHKETGAPVTTCAGNHRFILDFLEGAGVPPERVCLSHADASKTIVELLALLRRGCSANFTIWGIQNPRLIGWPHGEIPKYYSAELMAAAVAEGFMRQVMPAIDYSAMGGFEEDRVKEDLYEVEGRTYLYLFTHAVPQLKKLGVSDEDIEIMLRDNPRHFLARR